MQRRDDGRTGPGWIREALAGATGALTVLPVLLTLGLLAFAPVGAAAPPVALLAVLAGVMLTVALGLADRWTGRLLARWWAGERSGDMALSLAVVALVVGTTLWLGMAAGIALGVLLSLPAFAVCMNSSLVHQHYRASARPSRRLYPAALEARLRPLRERVSVFELDGALFFGSSARLLDEAGAHEALAPVDVRAMAQVPLAESSLMAGLDAAQVAAVAAHLQPLHLDTGAQLFAEGDAGDRLYVVGQGSVSILSAPDRGGRTQRYLSVSPGMMIGETAMLDGGGRTAGAVAGAPTVVYALTRAALDGLGHSLAGQHCLRGCLSPCAARRPARARCWCISKQPMHPWRLDRSRAHWRPLFSDRTHP